MNPKTRKTMLSLFVVLTLVVTTGIWLTSCSENYPIPTGKYKVGTQLLSFADSTRTEWALPDSNAARRFAARVWYPAQLNGSETRLPRMEKPIKEGMKKLYGFPSGNRTAVCWSYENASIQTNGKKYPILIFAHGAGSFVSQNLSSMEELASQGYVVFSLSFSYESVATIFPDSSVVPMNNMDQFKSGMKTLVKNKKLIKSFSEKMEELKNPNAQKANLASIELGELYKKSYPGIELWLKARVNDMHHLISQFSKIQVANTPLKNFADIEKIGLFGHSLGGITTFQYLIQYNNPAVKCGIALDAPFVNLFGSLSPKLHAPVLQLTSEEQNLGKTKIPMLGINDFLKHYTTQSIYECNVKGAAHFNFSDMNYLPRFIKMTPLLGKISQSEAIKIMAYYQQSFFDVVLKDDNTNLYSNEISKAVRFRTID